MKYFFGFPRVPYPAPGRLDLERFGEINKAGAQEFGAFPRAGSVSNPRRLLGLRSALPLGPRARGSVPRIRSRSA